MNDLEMDRWADIYRANHVVTRSAGMTFEQFLQRPAAILQALVYDMAVPLEEDEDFYPLLPAQQLVAARVAADESLDVLAEQVEAELLAESDVRYQDNHLIEPLRHHARGVQRERRRIS